MQNYMDNKENKKRQLVRGKNLIEYDPKFNAIEKNFIATSQTTSNIADILNLACSVRAMSDSLAGLTWSFWGKVKLAFHTG